ncbi:uncharacterized protein [Hyperolius riggenbachi]|uniref:uncharacterized protein n=1 Tax=Hyperolius riggenbachi TaxID=752182 RepID=UPI0035A3A213
MARQRRICVTAANIAAVFTDTCANVPAGLPNIEHPTWTYNNINNPYRGTISKLIKIYARASSRMREIRSSRNITTLYTVATWIHPFQGWPRPERTRKKTRRGKRRTNRFPCDPQSNTEDDLVVNLSSRPLSVIEHQAFEIVRKHWSVISSDQRLAPVFKEPPMCAFKRSRSVRDTLVHARNMPVSEKRNTDFARKSTVKCTRKRFSVARVTLRFAPFIYAESKFHMA